MTFDCKTDKVAAVLDFLKSDDDFCLIIVGKGGSGKSMSRPVLQRDSMSRRTVPVRVESGRDSRRVLQELILWMPKVDRVQMGFGWRHDGVRGRVGHKQQDL